MNFTTYLQEQFTKNNPEILDDLLPDNFSDWIDSVDIQEIIDYADKYKAI